jgi:hypothetical protein
LKCGKTTARKSVLVFPRFQQPKRIGLLICRKTQARKAALVFQHINNLMMIKILIYEINKRKEIHITFGSLLE